MICSPCRTERHDICIDVERAKTEPIDTEGKPLALCYRSCFCQHVVKIVAEPETGDPHDC